MTYEIEKSVPRPTVIKEHLPLTPEINQKVEKDREEVKDILEGKDNRKILILGPCSAWPSDAVIEYAKKLQPAAEKVKDKIKIVMRVYTQKPRTTTGWTGPINQPDPSKEPDIEKGVEYCRKMMIEVLQQGLPIADEALFTHNEGYFKDLLCYVAIGARSAEDQEHRVYASMLDIPVGMKNPTSGDLKIGTNSVLAAQSPHVFLLHGKQVRTKGNKHAHLILRGGNGQPNVSPEELEKASNLATQTQNPSIIIDLSHENSVNPETGKKEAARQATVLRQAIQDLRPEIKGFMLESFLQPGKQDINGSIQPGISVTDECIGIEETIKLIEELHQKL